MKVLYLGEMPERDGDLIVATKKRLGSRVWNLEAMRCAVRPCYGRVGKSDGADRHLRMRRDGGIELSHDIGPDASGQQSVAEGVLIEDIGEARGEDAADPELHQGPHSRLARTAATEILIRDEDACPAKRLSVENKLGILAARVGVAPPGEKPPAEIGMG